MDNSTPQPERQFITRLAGTSLFISMTEEPWRIYVQALVLPMGPRAGMNGQLARDYRQALGSSAEEEIRKIAIERVEAENGSRQLKPEQPVLISLPDFVQWPMPFDTNLAYKGEPPHRYIVAATAYETDKATVEGASMATQKLLEKAVTSSISSIILPTLGTGQGNLTSTEVMQAMVAGLQSILLSFSASDSQLNEITLITRDEDSVAVAFDFFNRRSQKLFNDLPKGGDLLNVAIEARALAETLLLRDLAPPLSVAIIGGWGSGKSFIMHLMQERMTEIRVQKLRHEQTWPSEDDVSLKNDLFPYVGHIYQIKFDAWTFAKGNLWSSLMQTIFFELNRQLSLEKRLRLAYASEDKQQEDGVQFLLEGGDGWKILNEMNDDERDELLSSNFKQIYKKWEEDPTGVLDNALWKELKELQEERLGKQIAAFNAKKEEIDVEKNNLDARQAELAQTNSELDRLKDEKKDLTQKAQDEALRNLPADVLKRIGVDAYNNFEHRLKSATDVEGNFTPFDLSAFRPDTTRIFVGEVLKKPENLRLFLFLIVLGTFVFLLATLFNEIIFRLLGFVSALGAFLSAYWKQFGPWLEETLKTIKQWDREVEKIYTTYQQEVKKQQKKIEKINAKAITKQEQRKNAIEKTVAVSKEKLANLEVELEQQRLLISPFAGYDNLLHFVNARLNDTYEKDLGFVHLVQRDLRELSNSLVADLEHPERIPQRLRDLFPRGPARIVLFIDDLDRCPPDQVVQVLEAVQLLLKTELFVVVLAIDVRYVARALEKKYEKILVRRGNPSGLDYIEKIIQIPYRVRSIEMDALNPYLRAQMQLQEVTPLVTVGGGQSYAGTQDQSIAPGSSRVTDRRFDVPPSRVLEFTESDLDNLQKCCQQVDLSPRAIKRLINVSKIIKVIWYRSQFNPSNDVVRGVFGLLALSDRFPDFMRELFEAMATQFRLGNKTRSPFYQFIAEYQPENLNPGQMREWNTMQETVQNHVLLPENLSFDTIGLLSFNLIRSFCFVGDIGYDPQDEKQDKLRVTLT